MILNLRTDDVSKAVRVDRKTRWGNPFELRKFIDREACIAAFRQWLWGEIKSGKVSLSDLAALDGRDLACWCAPKACHADVLESAARWAVARLEEKKDE